MFLIAMKHSPILEIRGSEARELFKALAVDTRLDILLLIAESSRNINEISQALGMSQPTVSKHIQQLEHAGLVVSEYSAGQQGMQKRCRLNYDRLLISFENLVGSDTKVEEVSMPIGLYTLVNPGGTCGLANRERMIGFLDIPQSFYDPARATAQIMWMAEGFVEYVFPCTLPPSARIQRLELLTEICAEAPNFDPEYPSDITLWLNGVEVGTWVCPGDFGGKRGLLNPDWWIDHMTQYGAQKIWSVDPDGSYVDGGKVSETNLSSILITPNQPITVRIGVKPDALHPGGFNLFGSGFGNYAQDLVLRLHYISKDSSIDRGNSASKGMDSTVSAFPMEEIS
jgi:predicted transcriptional regulator